MAAGNPAWETRETRTVYSIPVFVGAKLGIEYAVAGFLRPGATGAIFVTFGERNAIMTTGYATSKLRFASAPAGHFEVT